MDEKSLEAIEYHLVREGVAAAAFSELGRAAAAAMAPLETYENARQAMAEADEAMTFTDLEGGLPLGGISDICPFIERVKKDGVLGGPELLTLGEFLMACARCSRDVKDADRYPILAGYAAALDPCRELADEIAKAIDEEGNVRDDATPALAAIRKDVGRKKDDIRGALDRIIRSPKMKKWLREPIVTQRGGRYVLPVRTDSMSHVRGVVHGHSSSGVTAFVEPMPVVELNNELERLLAAEEEEVAKILRRISYVARENADALASNLEIVSELDFIAARAGYGRSLDGETPSLSDNPVLKLKRARHPSLVTAPDGRDVVPIDVEVGDDYAGMLISGPNAGGKTVALKTAGLLTAMALSGVPVPAAKDSAVGFFKNIYADIGDESSIEGNLSTFTAHMVKALKFVNAVNDRSLVLIDEIGVGTSPKYGAAIAAAVLRRLKAAGALVLATTHYDDLKMFALENEGYVNAAVEFDAKTLAPLYNLVVGRPGSSEAVAILGRVGFPRDFLSEVEAGLDEEETKLGDLLTRLETKEREVTTLETGLLKLEEALRAKQAGLDAREAEAEEHASSLRDDAYAEAARIVKEARRQAAAIVKELKEAEGSRAADSIRTELAEMERELREKEAEETGRAGRATGGVFSPGDWVIVRGTSTKGQIVAVEEGKNRATVKFGSVAANVDLADLEHTKGDRETRGVKTPAAPEILPSIDLIGSRVEEALVELDKYLDAAAFANLKSVEVIHGHGTGALRDGIRRFLKTHRIVKEFGPGPEGNEGVTVAVLK
ncbi:MAG: endonuclease MutS2 [Candidatus Coatesbacteria bacterium]|nr:MAG: endonuclease MutS2 [Candidatus Coatesbacteria bacterium]